MRALPERLIGLDHPAVAALAGATGPAGVGACFGVAERSPDGRPQIAQVFAAAPACTAGAPAKPWQRGFDWWEGSALGDACRHARRLGLWIALAGQAGSTVDEDFPGLAALVGPDGGVIARLPDWRAGSLVVDIR